jgi:hypothetical protein
MPEERDARHRDLRKTGRGATILDRRRFRFWCEEILVARTSEKTGRIRARNEANDKSKLAEAQIFERPTS